MLSVKYVKTRQSNLLSRQVGKHLFGYFVADPLCHLLALLFFERSLDWPTLLGVDLLANLFLHLTADDALGLVLAGGVNLSRRRALFLRHLIANLVLYSPKNTNDSYSSIDSREQQQTVVAEVLQVLPRFWRPWI